MGITIHYSGWFNPAAFLSKMIEEVIDIVSVYKWPYHLFETSFVQRSFDETTYNDELYGISFTPQ